MKECNCEKYKNAPRGKTIPVCPVHDPIPQPELSKCCGAETWEVSQSKLLRCSKCGNSLEPQKEEGKCSGWTSDCKNPECPAQDEDWEEELQVEVMEDYINCIEETVGMSHQLYGLKVGKRREHWEKLKSFIKSLLQKEREEVLVELLAECEFEKDAKGCRHKIKEYLLQALSQKSHE